MDGASTAQAKVEALLFCTAANMTSPSNPRLLNQACPAMHALQAYIASRNLDQFKIKAIDRSCHTLSTWPKPLRTPEVGLRAGLSTCR